MPLVRRDPPDEECGRPAMGPAPQGGLVRRRCREFLRPMEGRYHPETRPIGTHRGEFPGVGRRGGEEEHAGLTR